MAGRYGSLSRSLMSAARTSASRSSAASHLPRLRPVSANGVRSRRSLLTISRNLGALGCTQSMLPLHSMVASSRLVSHISLELRTFCELSQGT